MAALALALALFLGNPTPYQGAVIVPTCATVVTTPGFDVGADPPSATGITTAQPAPHYPHNEKRWRRHAE